MAPEQAEGDLAKLAGWTDVYALGSILFELLTFHQLHLGKPSDQRILSTLDGSEAHPMQRAGARHPD